jgi:hypothetical protein
MSVENTKTTIKSIFQCVYYDSLFEFHSESVLGTFLSLVDAVNAMTNYENFREFCGGYAKLSEFDDIGDIVKQGDILYVVEREIGVVNDNQDIVVAKVQFGLDCKAIVTY